MVNCCFTRWGRVHCGNNQWLSQATNIPVTTGQGVMTHSHSQHKGHTFWPALTLPVYTVSIFGCNPCEVSCRPPSPQPPPPQPTDTQHTHKTHATQNYQDLLFHNPHTTAQPLLSTQGDTGIGFSYHQQRWSRLSSGQVGTDIL